MKNLTSQSTENLFSLNLKNLNQTQMAYDVFVAGMEVNFKEEGVDSDSPEFWTDLMYSDDGRLFFVAADGELSSDSNSLTLDFDYEDLEMLEKIGKFEMRNGTNEEIELYKLGNRIVEYLPSSSFFHGENVNICECDMEELKDAYQLEEID